MKVLIINGSPKGERSNTIRLTDAFVKGMEQVTQVEVDKCTLVRHKILPCCGCFSCWGATPGQCVIKDDCEEIRKKVLWADVIIESFPLYFFGMPSQMKTFTDRMVPFTQSYCGESADGKTGSLHEMRFGIQSKKMIVISTCGYTNTHKIYESLKKQYDCICGEGGYTFLACPQGELFHVSQINDIVDARLAKLTEAGEQWMKYQCVETALCESIAEPMIPARAFELLLKTNWKLAKEEYDKEHEGISPNE